jgi:hypothetical protein
MPEVSDIAVYQKLSEIADDLDAMAAERFLTETAA